MTVHLLKLLLISLLAISTKKSKGHWQLSAQYVSGYCWPQEFIYHKTQTAPVSLNGICWFFKLNLIEPKLILSDGTNELLAEAGRS